jgi:hypothetical protein
MGWSLIGQAIRLAYLLRLDKVSFREVPPGISQELAHRHRLAWICKSAYNWRRQTMLTGYFSCLYIGSPSIGSHGSVLLVARAVIICSFHS